jgi:hypothetical protein
MICISRITISWKKGGERVQIHAAKISRHEFEYTYCADKLP